jgi:hypothetical protein
MAREDSSSSEADQEESEINNLLNKPEEDVRHTLLTLLIA